MNPLLIVWNLQEIAVKPFAHFYKNFNGFENPGSCSEAMIDGLESPGGRREAITFTKKCSWFGELQEAAANPLLMVWNLQEVAVKQFTHFLKMKY